MLFIVIKERISDPCVYPEINALCWSMATLMLINIIWRYLGPWMQNLIETVQVGIFKLTGSKPIADLISVLQLKMLPTGLLWFLLTVFALFPFFARNPNFPFHPYQTAPIIQGFSVRSTTTQFHQSGDTITVPTGQQILVEAIIAGEFTEPCEWYAVKGTFLRSGKCSILYTRPIGKSGDSLTITANSQCGTLQTSKGLLVAP